MKKIIVSFFMVFLITILSACSQSTKTFVKSKDNEVQEWNFSYKEKKVNKVEFITKEAVAEENINEMLKEYGFSGLLTTDPKKFLAAALTIEKKSKVKEELNAIQEYLDQLALREEMAIKEKGIDANIKYSLKNNEKISKYKIKLSKVDRQLLDEMGFSFLYEMEIEEIEQMFLEEGFVSKEDFVLNSNSNKTLSETQKTLETDRLFPENQETNEEIEETTNQIEPSKSKNQEMKVLVGEYIFPSSNSDYLSYEEIEYIVSVGGSDLLRLAINEMYARHGFIFSKQKNKTYFSEKTWYYPVEGLTDEYVKTQLFNEYETENLKRLLEVEQKYK